MRDKSQLLNILAKCLVLSLFLSCSPSVIAAQTSEPEVADDTLIVVTKPYTDTRKLSDDLWNTAQATTVKELHAEQDNWSILHLQPYAGQRESTLAKINTMLAGHPEIIGVTRNYLLKKVSISPPNDPYFSQQWTLSNLNWPKAQALYQNLQLRRASITVVASGVKPITANNELGSTIQQFDASIPGEVKAEPLFCVDEGPGNLPGEGDVDCQVGGCLTDNSALIAGAADFGNFPVNITMLRGANTRNPYSVTGVALDNALIWALNNQRKRCGPGPINISYGLPFGTNAHGAEFTPLWQMPDILNLASSFYRQGDLMVIASGDSPGTWTGKNAKIVKGLCVIQGSDQNNALVNSLPADVYGPGVGLTTVQGDPLAAPGTLQPCIGTDGSFLAAELAGTSFSAPWVSSAISLLMAVNPALTGQQAYEIIVRTGTTAGAPTPQITPSWHVVVPNFAAAIKAAAGR